MTKWARMRRRKERRRVEQEPINSIPEVNETKPTEQKKIPDKIEPSQKTQKLEISQTSKSNPILAQIPRYVYLLAIFALLSGVFFPFVSMTISETTTFTSLNFVIGGTITLFLGVSGCILLLKGITSDNKRVIFLASGFVLIAISLALIFQIQDWWKAEFYN